MKLATIDRSLKDTKIEKLLLQLLLNCTLHMGCKFYKIQTPINYLATSMNKVYFVRGSDAFGYT